MTLTLERNITAGFAVLLFVLLFMTAIGYRSTAQLATDAQSVQRAHRVQTALTALQIAVNDAEVSQGRFTITGEARFLEPFRDAEQRIANETATLRALISDSERRQQLEALMPVIARRVELAKEIIELRRTQGFEVASARVASGETKQVQDRIRAEVARMLADQQRLVRVREDNTGSTAQFTVLILAVGATLAIVAVGAGVYLLNRSFMMRKNAENQLHRSHKEVIAAKERAESSDRLKSTFLATMSHELRTPLNSIIGFTGVLLQELPGPLNAEQRKQLSLVQGSGRHLLSLINDVLDISKIEAGELKIQRSPFAVRDVIEKSVALVKPLADKKQLPLLIDTVDDLGDLANDARRCEQVLLNLLNNAVKFTERGAVTVSARRQSAELVITVTDTGSGIREEDLQILFQPFRQIDSALSRSHDGTGLGLTICQKLMELMGGSIRVASRWGHGSSFTITFPTTLEHA